MPRLTLSIAHTVEVALREFKGPFLARVEMKTKSVWVGKVSELLRDSQDTWIVMREITSWPYGNNVGEVHLRAAMVKSISTPIDGKQIKCP